MKFLILIVIDGWGIAPPNPGNAITSSHLPFYNSLLTTYPHGLLEASGESVGLPRSEDGNTETGHLNLGAGRIVYQDLPRINMAIADGSFFQNTSLLSALTHANKTGGNLHIMGLIGAGGIHSNIEHLFALMEFCKQHDFNRVLLHLFTDGRDSPPSSAQLYLTQVQEHIKTVGMGKIASVMGRYYAMDRDRRWDRTEKAYLVLTQGIGRTAGTPEEAIKLAYAANETDEFIKPTVITTDGKPTAIVKEGDSAIFYNFRIDRPRELTKAFVSDDFENEANQLADFDPFAVKYYKKHDIEQSNLSPPFKRGDKIKDLFFVTMTEYSKTINASAVAYPPQRVLYPIGRIFSEQNIQQLRMTESEKERFVTYYFNGLLEEAFQGEERIIVPSPKVSTYDLKPEMSSDQLTGLLIKEIQSEKYGFILVNFPNPDMVAHTGNIPATIKACETVDNCLSKVIPEVLLRHGAVLLTSDHGNAEELIDQKTGGVETEHSTAPVPFIVIAESLRHKNIELPKGILADVAPTTLALLKIDKPISMSGRNLLQNIVDLP